MHQQLYKRENEQARSAVIEVCHSMVDMCWRISSDELVCFAQE